ncbi:lysophospholipid acyltransferase 7-like [Pieris brassicae]|nr:lysophospholipid acyltransferase 7-like [Pieris brassicae]
MGVDTIIFYSSLVMCMTLGSYYKKISEVNLKRNFGTGLGFLVTCLICGTQIYHTVLLVWGNIVIIKCCDRRYLHQISLAYTWMYLFYLHYYLPPNYVIWIYQTLALRLVGLAFEIHLAHRAKGETRVSVTRVTIGDSDLITNDPSAVDIITYTYFFIGLHKGPYYRWKIFEDHFSSPFATLGDCRVITEQKLKKVCMCALGYMLLRMKYSPEFYYMDEFYTGDYGTDFRYLYNIPQLMSYFLFYQITMLLCTSVCTETGFGIYPAKCVPIPGFGPSARFSLLKVAAGTTEAAIQEEYNFSMLKCFDHEKLLIGPKMKDSVRSWDMPTRFWFWSNVYKNSLRANKEVRSAWSFFAWTIWCSPTLPQTIISATLWVYIHLESEYSELYDTSGTMKLPWDIGFSIMRLFCLIYLTPCFIVSDTSVVLRYYNSIYWIFHVILFVLMVAAIIIYKLREE